MGTRADVQGDTATKDRDVRKGSAMKLKLVVLVVLVAVGLGALAWTFGVLGSNAVASGSRSFSAQG